MSYDLEKKVIGHESLVIYEIDLDSCLKEYGKSYTNLLTYSEQFDNAAWTDPLGRWSVAANTEIAPNGTITADVITMDVSGAIIRQAVTALTGSTASCWMKVLSGTLSSIAYDHGNGAQISVQSQLKDGEWARVSADSLVKGGFDWLDFQIIGSAGLTLAVWGGQLVNGNAPGHYVKTEASSATGSCDATDAKANLLWYSENYVAGIWAKVGAGIIVTPDAIIAPDGTFTADLIDVGTTATADYFAQSKTVVDDTSLYTVSIYAKAGTATTIGFRLRFTGGSTISTSPVFDTVTKAFSGLGVATASHEELSDGWFRIIFNIANNGSGNTTFQSRFAPDHAANFNEGTAYFWGAQLVEGSQAGIYYKTGAASFSGTVGTECYDTFVNCQDIPNYEKIIKTYRFMEPLSNLPKIEGFPCIKGAPELAATTIYPNKGLGARGVATVKMVDFPHHDSVVDPYVRTRTYVPFDQGSFFGKLKARNPFYAGRKMRIRTGFLTDTFSWDNFEDRNYIIDSFNGPDESGNVTIVGKDILKLADDKRAQVPLPSEGTLSVALTAVATSLVLQTGEGIDYDTDPYTGQTISPTYPGYVRVGDEYIKYTGVSTDTLTGLVRSGFGTTASEGDVDDIIQLCFWTDNASVVDIYDYLLKVGAGLPEEYIPYDAGKVVPTGTNDEWDDEKNDWLSSNNLTGIIGEPTGVNKILSGLTRQNLCYMWWDEIGQKVKMKAIAPTLKNVSPPVISDDLNIIEGSISVIDDDESRISQLWVYYNKIDYAGDDEATNYKNLYIQVDTESESENAYDSKRVVVIYADWLTSLSLVITLAGRLLNKYNETPRNVKFTLGAKDTDIWTGSAATIDSRMFQSDTGANQQQKAQVVKVTEKIPGQRYDYEVITTVFEINKYGFIGPDSLLDYTLESDANKQAYGFVSDDAGLMSNGDDGYLIA